MRRTARGNEGVVMTTIIYILAALGAGLFVHGIYRTVDAIRGKR